MSDDPTVPLAFMDLQRDACTSVRHFIEGQVFPLVGVVPQQARRTPELMLLRASDWLSSLGKLDHPSDFQPAITGSRAMFEIAVDMTLLALGRESVERYEAWEKSELLAALEHVVRKHGDNALAAPEGVRAEIVRWKAVQPEVESLRKKHWPARRKKPTRFTARTLHEDADEADRLHPVGHFGRYKVRALSLRNLNVHGSAVAVRNVGYAEFPLLAAFSFAEAAHFAIVAAEMLVRIAGVWSDTAQGMFDAAREKSGVSLGHLMDKPPDPHP